MRILTFQTKEKAEHWEGEESTKQRKKDLPENPSRRLGAYKQKSFLPRLTTKSPNKDKKATKSDVSLSNKEQLKPKSKVEVLPKAGKADATEHPFKDD